MNFQYYCPECKKELRYEENEFQCHECSNKYYLKNDCIDFENKNFIKIDQKDNSIENLLDMIKNKGYEKGIQEYITKYDEFKEELTNTQYDKSVDYLFHGIGKNFSYCLEIGGNLGNKSEILSKIFNQVYTIEFNDELIKLQTLRCNEKKIDNISIMKSNLLKLPFPDNHFDLILGNDILENIEKFEKRKNQKEFQRKIIKEFRRVLNDEGCIIFELNRIDSKNHIKNKMNYFKKIGKKRFSKYQTLLKNENLITKSFWTYPSYNRPLYSGDIFDKISSKAFFKNFSSLISLSNKKTIQTKIIDFIFLILDNTNYPFSKNLIEILSPSFVFCCWKKNNLETFEDWVKKETGYQNILRVSRHEKILFLLLNKKSEIEKCLYVKRYGHKMPKKIKFFEREKPEEKSSERIVMTNWIKGRPVNYRNHNEVMKGINELINFQIKTKSRLMNSEDITNEITFIKKGLEHYDCKDEKYNKWLEQYEKQIKEKNINLTSVHGDFWLSNLIYDSESKKINIIDWDGYLKEGNPLVDFIWLLCNLMGMSSKNYTLQFKKHLEEKGENSNLINLIKNKMNLHFGFKIDYILLLKIYLIKWMIIQKQTIEKNTDNEIDLKNIQTIKHEKLLGILSNY